MSIRAVAIDVEGETRKQVGLLLRDQADFELVCDCEGTALTQEGLLRIKPSLTIVEIASSATFFPNSIGECSVSDLTNLIVIASSDQFALQAFDAGALDYLVKPFSHGRFYRALEKARNVFKSQRALEYAAFAASLLKQERPEKRYVDRLVYRNKSKIVVVPVEEIRWIEAEGNYVNVHTGKQSYLFRETISGMESKLDPKRFLRVHRSSIVNISHIREFQPWGENGEPSVLLRDETRLSLGPTYRERISSLLTN